MANSAVFYKTYPPKILQYLLKRKLIAGLLILVIVGIPGFFIFQQTRAPKVKMERVERGDIRQELSLSGEIDAEEKANLSFQTGGLVSWVGVKEGDHVNKFTLIASLDQRSARKSLEKQLLSYLLKRSEFDETREENLNRTPEQAINNEMRRILERNQWNLDLAVNSVELQYLVIQLSSIYSPIEGIVTKANTKNAGINVAPFSTQFVIVNPNSIYFNVTADQTEIVNLKKGLRGEIILDAYPEEKLSGEIANISFTPRGGEIGTVYDVRVSLSRDNLDLKYLLGMTGDITFVTSEKKNVTILKLEFVKTDDKGNYVYIDPGKTKKKYIEVGLEGEDVIEVKGIDEGTIVYD